jgi:broad specificity phosphatase PhoE
MTVKLNAGKRQTIRLILCRHGESDGNAALLSQGFTPGRLTHRGAAQAIRLGSLLREQLVERRTFDEVWSSDSLRALQTCALALMHLDGESHPVTVDPLLREKNAGVFEGKPREEINIARKRYGNERLFKPKGGESWGDLQKRAVRFLGMLRERFHGANAHVLVFSASFRHLSPALACILTLQVFTHGGFIKELINAFVPSPGRSAAPACVNNRLVSSTPRHMMPRTCATQSALVRCGCSLTEAGEHP